MRTFLPLAFWYWLYNQLFFFLGALGFFVIHFIVAIIGFGAWILLPALFLQHFMHLFFTSSSGVFSGATGCSNIILAVTHLYAPPCCR